MAEEQSANEVGFDHAVVELDCAIDSGYGRIDSLGLRFILQGKLTRQPHVSPEQRRYHLLFQTWVHRQHPAIGRNRVIELYPEAVPVAPSELVVRQFLVAGMRATFWWIDLERFIFSLLDCRSS